MNSGAVIRSRIFPGDNDCRRIFINTPKDMDLLEIAAADGNYDFGSIYDIVFLKKSNDPKTLKKMLVVPPLITAGA
ncbi:MAG: hypothetical protein LBB13_01505 [Rickettsiales bacterium]|jgi:hypothetical protein|nr:hypothetical protein [Rickettsiales bacterium]